MNLEKNGLFLMSSVLPWKGRFNWADKSVFYNKKGGSFWSWKVCVLPQKRGSFSNWKTRMGTIFSSEWGSREIISFIKCGVISLLPCSANQLLNCLLQSGPGHLWPVVSVFVCTYLVLTVDTDEAGWHAITFVQLTGISSQWHEHRTPHSPTNFMLNMLKSHFSGE